MSKNQPPMSKRQIVREQRLKKQRQQRVLTIVGITVAALAVAAFLILPSFLESVTPVGEVVSITPRDLPSPEGTALGDPDAPVEVVVYEDFQCSACRVYTEQIEPLIIENEVASGEARYVFRHFPFLDQNVPSNESHQAANASMCAADQGRFWDYHDILFANWNGENQGAFSDRRLIAFAEELGLDMAAFQTCFEENRFEDQIEADLAAGRENGVTGTPTVFVDGEVVNPGFVPSYEDISTAIDQALAENGG